MGKIFPCVFANESSGFLVVGALFGGCGPTDVVEKGTRNQKLELLF
jgi:hypothetical protein